MSLFLCNVSVARTFTFPFEGNEYKCYALHVFVVTCSFQIIVDSPVPSSYERQLVSPPETLEPNVLPLCGGWWFIQTNRLQHIRPIPSASQDSCKGRRSRCPVQGHGSGHAASVPSKRGLFLRSRCRKINLPVARTLSRDVRRIQFTGMVPGPIFTLTSASHRR